LPISPTSLAGDLVQDDDRHSFDYIMHKTPFQSDKSLVTGIYSPSSVLDEAPISTEDLLAALMQPDRSGHHFDPPYILSQSTGQDLPISSFGLDGPEWTADRPITIHGKEYTSLADHLADLNGSMNFLNKYRYPESLRCDYTASPPYMPADTLCHDMDLTNITSFPEFSPLYNKSDSSRVAYHADDDDMLWSDSPPYVPMDYNTLRPDLIDPDDDKYYIQSSGYSSMLSEDEFAMSPTGPITISPPSNDFDYTRFHIPTPGYHASP
ncbi:hypothetical protein BGZ65_001723, partial [Modicella reniformis]